MGQRLHSHTYRLRLADDGNDVDHEIEFDADEPHAALDLARKYCGQRSGALFQDGQKLADIEYDQGFWHIS